MGVRLLWRVMSAKTFRFIWIVNLMYTEYLNGEILYPNFNFSHLNGECVASSPGLPVRNKTGVLFRTCKPGDEASECVYPNLILTFGCIS